jgi:pyruvate dehydrogenase E2 component (dihydrolipoamide acetyltransferase)
LLTPRNQPSSGYVELMANPPAPSTGSAGAKGEIRIEEPSRAQRTIARRSAEARATVPDVELTAVVELAESVAQASQQFLTATLVRACAGALQAVPRANASYRDGRYELYSRINVGVIVASDGAYAIPTLFDCERKPAAALADELAALERRARDGELLAAEQSGATFTLWHPGVVGVASATPIVVPPQAAAVAGGAVRAVPVIDDGAVVPGHCMTITLACDHRILYGSDAARFLAEIAQRLAVARL